ncbi:MAG TPA: response regulator [Nitrososphaera sp.]|nr:response regulator [Nitrososphaera sp.]
MRDSILLVDQKHSTANLMKTYLRADGYAVDHTPDPKEAVVFATHTDYSLVITDLVMRGMTGIDLYREIKYTSERQIIFMFLLRPSSQELRLMGSLDRKDVIKKEPLSINEVITKVRAAITNNQ